MGRRKKGGLGNGICLPQSGPSKYVLERLGAQIRDNIENRACVHLQVVQRTGFFMSAWLFRSRLTFFRVAKIPIRTLLVSFFSIQTHENHARLYTVLIESNWWIKKHRILFYTMVWSYVEADWDDEIPRALENKDLKQNSLVHVLKNSLVHVSSKVHSKPSYYLY